MRALELHRRAGGRLPLAPPGGFQDAPFEGYFWRFTDPTRGRVVVALCGLTRGGHARSALVGVATHPGRFVAASPARLGYGERDRFEVEAGSSLKGSASSLEASPVPGVRLRVDVHAPWAFPRRAVGAIGIGGLLPGLPQYWQPVLLGGVATGELQIHDERIAIRDACVYAERTWGPSFPERWWWGQAAAFDESDVTVAFAGGPIRLGGVRLAPTAAVVRLGGRLLGFAPPLASVRAAVKEGAWRIAMRSARHSLELEGDDPHGTTVAMPVPEHDRGEPLWRAMHALAGQIRLTLRCGRRTLFRGESPLAGLERGEPR